MRREVITLDEGDVVIVFPEDLSVESFGDLKDHLDLFVKKIQRRIGRLEQVSRDAPPQAPEINEEQKAKLREFGCDDDEIRRMSPAAIQHALTAYEKEKERAAH
jgi:hypothetical protein